MEPRAFLFTDRHDLERSLRWPIFQQRLDGREAGDNPECAIESPTAPYGVDVRAGDDALSFIGAVYAPL